MTATLTERRSGDSSSSAAVDRLTGVSGSVATKAPCKAQSTSNITLSGEQTIDGVSCTAGDRVLVAGQTSGINNGIYVVSTGNWARAPDFDDVRDAVEGSQVFVNRGTSNSGLYALTTDDPVIGTSALVFESVLTILGADSLTQGNNLSDVDDPTAAYDNLRDNGTTIVCANPLVLDNATDGDLIDVSGNTNFSAVTLAEDKERWVRFTGTPTITVGASLVGNNGGENVLIEAGDLIRFRGYASSVVRFTHFPIRPRQPLAQKGADITCAATITINTAKGRVFHITGSTGPVTDIDFTSAQDGDWAWLVFDSTPTLTHNSTTLKLPGGANITAAAGDRALFVQDSSDNVICAAYVRADGTAVVATSSVSAASQAQQETGSSTTTYVSPGRQQYHPSAPKFWALAAADGSALTTSYNVTGITDTGTGDLLVTIATDFSSASWSAVMGANGVIDNTNGAGSIDSRHVWLGTKAAGTIQLRCRDGISSASGGTARDPNSPWQIAGFGDQA